MHIKDDGEKLLGNIESLSTQVTTTNSYINRVSLCSSTGAGRTQGTGMPIVPVQVKVKDYSSPVEVYAFLGPRLNTTFCTKPLIKRLGVQGDEASLSLTTTNNDNVQSDCTVVNLMFQDPKEKNTIELPSDYSCEKLPVTAKDIPAQVEVNQWPHLKAIKLSSIESAKVYLLLTNDVLKALEPKQRNQFAHE